MTARARVSIAWLAAIAVCGIYLATRLRIDADFSGFLPEVATTEQRFLVAELREGVASRLLLIEIRGDSPERRAAVSKALAERLAADRGDFLYVNNGDLRWAQKDFDAIVAHRYQLSDALSADRFSAETLRAALQSDLRTLESGTGLLQKELLAEDPTGEALHIAERIAPRKQPAHEQGVWFSADGSAALLVAETRAAGSDLDGQARALGALQKAFGLATSGADVKLVYSSPGAMAVQSRSLVAEDAAHLALLSALLIIAVLALAYRSARVVALCAAPALAGLVVGIPSVDLAFGGVHAITLGFGATLLGEAVDYPSYLMTQVRGTETASQTGARLGRTLLMAVLTTAASSVAFLFAGFRGLAQLGMLTLIGVLAAGATTAWVVPSWVPIGWKPVEAPSFLRTWRLPRSGWTRVLVASAIVLTLVAIAATRSWWDDDLANMNPLPASLKEQDRALRAALGAPDVRWMLLIEGSGPEEVLERAEGLRPVLQEAAASGTVDGFELVSDYLPSDSTQRRRQAGLPDDRVLRANFSRAAEGLPLRIEAFEPFFAAIARARVAPLLRASDFEGTALGLKLKSLLHDEGTASYAVVPLAGVKDASGLRDALTRSGLPGVRWIDLASESRALMSEFRGRALRASAAGGALIFIVLAFGLGGIRAAARVALPVAVSVLATAAFLVALGIHLTVFHLVALMLVAGVGTNYALFLRRAGFEPDGDAVALRSIGVVVATTLCAFGVLASSHVPVLRAIGETVALGVIACLVFSVLLVPATRSEAEEAR